MTRGEQIKKAWESAFKNIVESIDTERTREEVACIFFELGCRWADENKSVDWQQVRNQAAIAAMQGFCNICHDSVIREIQESSDKERSNVISFLAVRMADALVKELKGE